MSPALNRREFLGMSAAGAGAVMFGKELAMAG
ncbi:MAG: twin-arginine translocation signal domain-containing protein, partial [Planctomycetes bacterium]|nr:twin-arginine translocation signal domain-containing protein [Planctomycetota bacterium]